MYFCHRLRCQSPSMSSVSATLVLKRWLESIEDIATLVWSNIYTTGQAWDWPCGRKSYAHRPAWLVKSHLTSNLFSSNLRKNMLLSELELMQFVDISQVSTYQMCILMLFNQHSSLSYKDRKPTEASRVALTHTHTKTSTILAAFFPPYCFLYIKSQPGFASANQHPARWAQATSIESLRKSQG